MPAVAAALALLHGVHEVLDDIGEDGTEIGARRGRCGLRRLPGLQAVAGDGGAEPRETLA